MRRKPKKKCTKEKQAAKKSVQLKSETDMIKNHSEDDISEIDKLKYPNEDLSIKLESSDSDKTDSLDGKNMSTLDDSPRYLAIELKLTSIDFNCANYKELLHRFLYINSNGNAAHVKKFILENMNISESLFEVVLMCNGFEVGPECPLKLLKDRFFPNKDLMQLYFAIIESKCNKSSKLK